MRCAVSLSGDARPAVRVSGTAPAWRPSHLHLGHLCSVHCALCTVLCGEWSVVHMVMVVVSSCLLRLEVYFK